MENNNPWVLLRASKAEQSEGLKQAKQAYARRPYGSEARQLGIAFLWLGRYTEAYEHFRSRIDSDPRSGDGDYGMAGVAKWCLGKPDEAVSEWRAGAKAKYARTAGLNIILPLLLYFAAVRQPKIFDRHLAETLIREKTGDIRINNWPGPIAKLVIDQISEAEFQNHCRGIRPGDDTSKNPFLGYNQQQTSNCLWEAEFYRSILALSHGGTLSDFKSSMWKLSDTSQPEWQDERNVFTVRIWHEEFFLARHEV